MGPPSQAKHAFQVLRTDPTCWGLTRANPVVCQRDDAARDFDSNPPKDSLRGTHTGVTKRKRSRISIPFRSTTSSSKLVFFLLWAFMLVGCQAAWNDNLPSWGRLFRRLAKGFSNKTYAKGGCQGLRLHSETKNGTTTKQYRKCDKWLKVDVLKRGSFNALTRKRNLWYKAQHHCDGVRLSDFSNPTTEACRRPICDHQVGHWLYSAQKYACFHQDCSLTPKRRDEVSFKDDVFFETGTRERSTKFPDPAKSDEDR